MLSGDFLDPRGKLIYPEFDLSPLRRDDIELGFLSRRDRVDAAEIEGADVLILLLSRFDRASIPAGGRLALVARFGMGLDNVDIEACTEHGIAVVNTPDGGRRSMALAAITLMLALMANLMPKSAIGRTGDWSARTAYNGRGLTRRTLGSIGFGNIAQEMFALARPFDMRFIAANRSGDHPAAGKLGVTLTKDVDTVFRESDVLVLNCPLTDQTRHLVNARRLALMKSTAYLINIARGQVCDQAALTKALRHRQIAGAALDVLDREPPDPDDPILALDNVIVTPHSLGWTDQLFASCGAMDVAAALAIDAGKAPDKLLNPQVAENPQFRAKLARCAARAQPRNKIANT
jgi:D-3-phosphoglycerate dehydrogenase